MSEDTGDPKIPSNEDVVEEITRDLETQFTIENQKEVSGDSTTKLSAQIAEEQSRLGIPEDFDKDEESPPVPDDYIDEEKLKDLEVALTDEEKQARHKEALDLKVCGNEEFKTEKYLQSIETYTKALRLCPLQHTKDRSIFYANRAASKAKLKRYESAIEDCDKAIELNETYVRAYLRRAKLYEETDKLDESLADYKKVLEFDSKNGEALQAQYRLPPKIEERNEKLKTEMLGKLKDLGNMILRPFGLSTENFQLKQDPNSGGYSVNFQQ